MEGNHLVKKWLFTILIFPLLAWSNEKGLIKEKSFFLRSHMDDLVHWRPWNKETFSLAKKSHRPIFVSVGFSACYWCKRLKIETFNNPEIADFINKNFVAVLVDRLEMPEVDEQLSLIGELVTSEAGWPLNVILTEEGKPYYAFHYLPAQKLHQKLIGLVSLGEHPEEIRRKVKVLEVQVAALQKNPVTNQAGPHRFYHDLPWDKWWKNNDSKAESILREIGFSLTFDPISGGFFRYSEGSKWDNPHFEKMLLENTILIQQYFRYYRLTKENWMLEIAKKSLQFLENSFMTEEKIFGHSLESQKAYYEFKQSEIQKTQYLIPVKQQDGNMLFKLDPKAKSLNFPELELIRNKKQKPELEKSLVFHENAAVISIYLEAFLATGEISYLDRAISLQRNLINNFSDFERLKMLGKKSGKILKTEWPVIFQAFIKLYLVTEDQEVWKQLEKVKGKLDQASMNDLFLWEEFLTSKKITKKYDGGNGTKIIIPLPKKAMISKILSEIFKRWPRADVAISKNASNYVLCEDLNCRPILDLP